MQIIPVIDVLNGQVVRAVGGERSRYRPIQSELCNSSEPASVAATFQKLGFTTAYVADLDAIENRAANFTALESIAEAELSIWLDAGIRDHQHAAMIAKLTPLGVPLAGVVVGLESVREPNPLSDIASAIGPERAVFSLDLRNGVPITKAPSWRHASPLQIVNDVVAAQFSQIIVLDLAHVGLNKGVGTHLLCAQIKQQFPKLTLLAGGGVRTAEDLRELKSLGCDGALVASALHERLLPLPMFDRA